MPLLPVDSLDIPGIYLVSPHAELIAAGKKSMIVKSRDFSDQCDKELILCSSGLCFGTLKMKLPRKVTRHELDELYPTHRITPQEIKDWWPDIHEFYLYDLYDVSVWDLPRHAEIPHGVQTFIKKVKFIDADEDQGCGKAWEVLFANGMAIQFFEKEEDADHFIASGKKDPGWFDFNRKRYTWVKREQKSPHHCWPVNKKPIEWIPSGKDSYIDGELAPVNPSGVELGEEIKLDELLGYFKSFYRTKPYVSLIGGICNWGKTKGDIDFFINSNHRDIATEFRIIRMFPQEYWHRFKFRYPYQEETHPGKFTNHIDIFDEKIEVTSEPELVLMSRKCTKIELFKFCPLLKPSHGRYKGEEYSIDKLIEVVNAKPEWYEKGIYVQKKFDGVHVRCDVQRHYESGHDVIIFSEEGNEITKNLPTLRKELSEASKGHAISIVGELEFWADEKHQSRQQTTAIIHTKEVHPDEKKVILNVFDCLYYERVSQDIHDEPYSERLKYLARIKEMPHIKLADYKLVHSPTELRKAVEHYSTLPGSEGAYLKRADFPYELDGKTLLNLKYKNTFSIDAKVLDVHEVEDANAFNYLCVIEDDIPIGRTYNTSIKVTKGAILKVEFVNLSQYTDPETKKLWFNWWSPRVIMAREDKKKPDNVLTAKKLVEASHGTVAEKAFPKRYEDAYPIEDSDPYLTYPDEAKKWKGMVHCHGRGRSVHLDFRAQMSADYATGWTLYIPKGLSKAPETFSEFKRLVDSEILPIVKDTMSNPLKKFNCGKKAPEPLEWLSYQGMVQPGEVGATKHEPGFFYIIDSFEVQFGAQKSYFHEYFCDGKIFNGRFIFRLLENRAEWKKTDEGLMTWMMFNALKSPTPYTISTRAVKKAWMPPFKASALPRNIRSKVPDRFKYWTIKDASRRREVRDELVNEIKKKLLKLDSIAHGEFKFLKQTWRGPKVIRVGPSRILYYFIFKQAQNYFALALNTSLLASETATGLPFRYPIPLWTAEGEVAPGSKLNPSKATPSTIEVHDQGKATVLSEGKFKRLILFGKNLKGVFAAFPQEGSNLWTIQKSKLPEPEEK